MTKILGVIPARYASTRFPGKPLADIGGMSMIRRVYEQAAKSSLSKVIVATDDQRILNHVAAFGGVVCMTSANHPSGTDRCFEALQKQSESYDYVINIQGDEPFIAPAQINLLASLLDGKVELATLIKAIDNAESISNPNVVKVVVNREWEAIYFSRSAIPYTRNSEASTWHKKHNYFKHIGMYAYRADILKKISGLPPTPLEKAESLEQLRWIENGLRIKVAKTDIETIGVDTPEDIALAMAFLKTTALS